MRLKVRCLPRKKCIGGTVRLVEAIVRKMCQKIEDVIGKCCLNPVLFTALQEDFLLRHQEIMLLLPHGTAQQICLTEAESGEHLNNLHDLLLIEHNAERFLQNRFEQGVHIDDLFFPVQAVDEVRHHAAAQGPRPIECDRRNEIDKPLRLNVLDEICHARRLHLEHSSRIPIAQHLCCFLIDQRNLIDIEINAMRSTYMVHCIRNDGECTQPQKVHLEESQCLHIVLIELCDKCAFGNPDRYLARKRIFRNHHTSRMDGDIARQPLNPAREINHSANTLIPVIDSPKIRRLLERTIEGDVQLRWNELGDV